MNELLAQQVVPHSGRSLRFKVELHGGSATFYNMLSDGTPEAVMTFNGSEDAIKRRFNHEVVEGEEWWFEFTGNAKAFYR